MTTCNLWNLLKWQPVIISHILFLCASDCVVVLQLENWSKKKCLRQKNHHKIAEMTITKVRIAEKDLMALKEWNLHESHCAVHVKLRFAVTLDKKWFRRLQTFSLHKIMVAMVHLWTIELETLSPGSNSKLSANSQVSGSFSLLQLVEILVISLINIPL